MHRNVFSGPKFRARMDSTPSDAQAKMEELRKMLQELEDANAAAVKDDNGNPMRTSATVEIWPRDKLQMAEYDHKNNIIRIPYQNAYASMMYYLNWVHESEHARQNAGVNYNEAQQRLLRIARAVYPKNVETLIGNKAKQSYRYNYGELTARKIEAIAAINALQMRKNAEPPDLRYDEIKDISEAISGIHKELSQQCSEQEFDINYMATITKLIVGAYQHDLVEDVISDIAFLLQPSTKELCKKELYAVQEMTKSLETELEWYKESAKDRAATEANFNQQLTEYRKTQEDKMLAFTQDAKITYNTLPEMDNVKTKQTFDSADAAIAFVLSQTGEIGPITIISAPEGQYCVLIEEVPEKDEHKTDFSTLDENEVEL